MLLQTFAIIRNTFLESIRQPIMLVLLIVATLAIILSNPLSAFTMDDDQRMLVDIGLATIFLSGALLAAFIATNVLGWEIENRTVLTVISKPVSRPLFVLGKFIGVAAALTCATVYMSVVFLLVEQHGVLQTVRDPIHVPVVIFGSLAAAIGLAVGIWCSYFYNAVFSSTVIITTTPLAFLAYVFTLFFDSGFHPQSFHEGMRPQLWLALIPLWIAIMVLTAIAMAVSTRLGQVMTLGVTISVFFLGMLSDWIFGRQIERMRTDWLDRARAENFTEWVDRVQTARILGKLGLDENEIVSQVEVSTVPLTNFALITERVEYALYWIGYSIVPNFQVLWLSDALTQNHVIPLDYIAKVSVYGLLYIIAALCIAATLFQRREVG